MFLITFLKIYCIDADIILIPECLGVSIRAEASKSDTALGMKKESQRMHEFHEKLKADRLPCEFYNRNEFIIYKN